MRRSAWQSWWVFVLACGPGAPGDDSATSSAPGTVTSTTNEPAGTASTSLTDPTTTTTTSGTTDAASASDATASASTTTSSTTDAASASDATASAGTTSEPPPFPPPCVPETDWDEPHFDCLLDWPTSTKIQGMGPAASLGTITQLFFGVLDQACIEGLSLEPIPIGDLSMPEAVLYRTVAECGPEQWPATYDLKGVLADDTEFFTTMTLDGFAGDWQSPDPVDPPRISGSFSGDLVGTFEAVHCATLDVYVNNCG